MAYVSKSLQLINASHDGKSQQWSYVHTDTLAAMLTALYISNGDKKRVVPGARVAITQLDSGGVYVAHSDSVVDTIASDGGVTFA